MTIFYADDDFDDRVLVKEALNEIDPSISCVTVCDGREAIDALSKAAQLPDYILLDINMPVMNGIECLTRLKSDEKFKSIPVVIYSTTSDPTEINFCYHLGALCFIHKPHSFPQLKASLRRFIQHVS